MHLCGFNRQLTGSVMGIYMDPSGLDSFTGILQGYLLHRDIGLRGMGLRGTRDIIDPLPIGTCTIGSGIKLPKFGQQLGYQRTLVA